MKQMIRHTILLLLAAALFASPLAAANKKVYKSKDEVDYVALAALLIRDGYYDRAQDALAQVKVDEEGVDLARLYTLKGLVFLKKKMFSSARDNFILAFDNNQTEKTVYIYLAQSHYGLKEYRETLDALDQAREVAANMPSIYSIRAQCHWKLEERQEAFDALNQGIAAFPDQVVFYRQRFFYLVDLGLFQEASEEGQLYLAKSEGGAEDYLAIGSALRQSGQSEKALTFLEEARLRFPGNDRITIELAHVYLDMGRNLTAASLFEDAAIVNNKFSQEAAELYKREKMLYRALSLNAKVGDQEEKLKQRLAILLDLENFEMAAAMAPALSRHNLLKNEDIRYALAYCYFKTGDYDLAEAELKKLTRPDLFRKAAELRKTMEKCAENKWQCI